MKHLFFVEDDLSLINGLSFALKKEGYAVDVARTKQEAEALWLKEKFDLVILDVSLPDGSGYDLCRQIRQTSTVPIIFLTAADEETEIIMGLDLGGDDYITKPFKLAVFLSRIHALLRRQENFSPAERELASNGIRVQRLERSVYKNGELVNLTAGEYKLLCLLMENPNQVLTPEQILSKLWDCDENYVDTNTLTVYIRRLRAKIEDDPSDPKKIVTLRRLGYRWNVPERTGV
ncbi:response regulator transcription factor [Holdemania filiformis]|uniref:DNA-binding response regulator n=1 Tax=Holdemania filiformis TaxID=61171 RepID=A0A412FZF2_9FIRM|nr:response regulator transcription factor [Holdemania filiformis]MBS5002291.1 response regulator transcription factor [Holdemania filiformis]RGR73574.1 DNA-binding response regulator [Holdemania filiformis]